MENVVGYRFVPTDEELINHYLKNKNLGNSHLVDEAINEVDIYRYHPSDLLQFSKIKPKDPVFEWHFFSRMEYTSVKETLRKRRTPSGFWKITATDGIIEDDRGNGGEIGIKKKLVFLQGKAANGVRTPWVMHEYHITCLPEHQRNYVLCKLTYNKKAKIPSGNISSEPSQSLVSGIISTPSEVEQPGEEFWNSLHLEDLENPINEQIYRSPWEQFSQNMFDDCHPNLLQVPYSPRDDQEFVELNHIDPRGAEFLFYENHSISRSMHGSHNDYMPKKSLSVIIANYSSDSEAESIAMSYQGTSSPIDSVGSSDKQKELFIMEEAMERKSRNPPYIYLMNVIISFILLVGLIGDIISVLLSANY